jgi:hypothetical protein
LFSGAFDKIEKSTFPLSMLRQFESVNLIPFRGKEKHSFKSKPLLFKDFISTVIFWLVIE